MPSRTDVTEIETQIDKLEIQLAALKEKRNRMVARLCDCPLELFVKIVIHLQRKLRETHDIRLWGNIIPVCRQFRDMSMQSPQLWSTFQMCHFPSHDYQTWPWHESILFAKWLAMCDKYGKDRITLRVVHGFDHDYRSASSPVYIPQSTLDWLTARTRIFTIDTEHEDEEIRYARGCLPLLLLQRSWPILENAQFNGCDGPYMGPSQGNINTRLLGGSCNSLIRLFLSGSWMLDKFPALPNLQHLRIDNLILHDRHAELRAFLSASGHLVSIEIGIQEHKWDKIRELMQSVEDPPVTLPHLESLTLCGDRIRASRVLDMLPLPRNFFCFSKDDDPELSDMTMQLWPKVSARMVAYLQFYEHHGTPLPKCTMHLRRLRSKNQATIGLDLRTEPAVPHIFPRGLHNPGFEFFSCCDIEDLLPFLRFSDRMVLEDISLFAAVAAMLESSDSAGSIMHLTIVKIQSDVYIKRFIALESFLKQRKERGNTLTSLEFGCGSLQDLRRDWVERGLVTRTNC